MSSPIKPTDRHPTGEDAMNTAPHRNPWLCALFLALAAVPTWAKGPPAASAGAAWQADFGVAGCKLATSGRNPYFVLEPGYQWVLEGGGVRMQITVLNQTKDVAGVTTRVVEEREWDKGQLMEVSRNYYALCEQSGDLLHYGEDVEVYKDGKLLKNEGTWLAGSNGNRPGLVLPGKPRLGMRYYQEIAPGVTLNRGEVVSLTESCKTPAGTFKQCMKIKGTSGLDSNKLEYKFYAPQIGLVRDANLRLVQHGPAKTP
jgi:hypothetical protein